MPTARYQITLTLPVPLYESLAEMAEKGHVSISRYLLTVMMVHAEQERLKGKGGDR